jgi:predicted alpha-1,2-mannosidase
MITPTMNHTLTLLTSLLLAPLTTLQAAETGPASGQPPRGGDPVDWVDPFIGTQSARWFFFTPAAAPFGLVKLAPDTTGFGGYAGGGHTSGYRFSDTSILGFSHLHDFQVGGILLMPTTGPLVTVPGADGQDKSGWRSRFSKSSERAEPGYYRVHLDKHDVSVELTASTRVGYHRYTFPKTDAARVLMDVGHLLGEGGVFQQHDRFSGGLRAAMIERVDDRTVRASCTIAPSYAEAPFEIYAEIRFNRPFKTHGAYRDAKTFPGREVITGFGAGYYVEFDTREEAVVEARVGISHVDFDGAKKNLVTETEGKTFDQIRAATRSEWNSLLGRVRIEDERPEAEPAKVKFYTALWHVLLGRGVNSDADGAYSDATGRRGQIPLVNGQPEYARYNSDALWGSFWNLNQVWSLLYPEQMTAFAKHLLASYRESGWLPDGFVVNRRAPGMLSNQASLFLAAAYARNPSAFDREELWNAVWKNQTQWRGRPRYTGQEALAGYSLLGYAPCDDGGYGPSGYTLEYAFEDWCAAQLATQFGKKSDADFLTQRSDAWRKLWDEETRCFRPRRFDGSFHTPFDPNGGYSFIEGTALQYRWFVPHNIPALVGQFTPEVFLSELTQTMAQAEKTAFGPAEVKNTAGLSLPYNHGNQPGLHTAWLFHFAGRPDLSRQYVRSICERFYGTTPVHGYGLGQDEDLGPLGAWYVLASMGLFDVEGMVRREAPVAVIPPAFARMVLTIPRAPFSGTKAGEFNKVELRQEAGASQSKADAFVPLHTLWEDVGPSPTPQPATSDK